MRNRIREVRKMKHMTQAEHVENICITRQYFSLIELGEEIPPLKVANEIAAALGTCMYEIFDLDGTGKNKCLNCSCK